MIDYFFHKVKTLVNISMVMMVKNEEDVITEKLTIFTRY